MFLWGASIWFLFKDTKWHHEAAEGQQGFDQPQAAPDNTYQGADVSPAY